MTRRRNARTKKKCWRDSFREVLQTLDLENAGFCGRVRVMSKQVFQCLLTRLLARGGGLARRFILLSRTIMTTKGSSFEDFWKNMYDYRNQVRKSIGPAPYGLDPVLRCFPELLYVRSLPFPYFTYQRKASRVTWKD